MATARNKIYTRPKSNVTLIYNVIATARNKIYARPKNNKTLIYNIMAKARNNMYVHPKTDSRQVGKTYMATRRKTHGNVV